MENKTMVRFTGIILILSGIITIVCFELLRQTIDYPDFLRKGTDFILSSYKTIDSSVKPLWYGMFAGSFFIMIGILLFHNTVKHVKIYLPLIVTTVGAFAGCFNMLGFIRWVFLVPHLSDIYNSTGASPAAKDTTKIIFEAFHIYLGVSVGEHLGMLFLALWGILLSFVLRKSDFFPKWISVTGIIFSIITLIGMLEPFGNEWASIFAAIGSSLQLIWIVLLGFYLLLKKMPETAKAKTLDTKITNAGFDVKT